MSIQDQNRLYEETKFNNEPNEEVYELNDYRRYRDKLIWEEFAEYSPRREQVESYSEDKCDNESLCLNEVFQDNLDTHTPPKERVKLCCEDVCEDESLCLDVVFQDNLDTHTPVSYTHLTLPTIYSV